jgi:hypothetical protein
MNFTISGLDSINLRKIGCIPLTRIVLHLAPICVNLEPTKVGLLVLGGQTFLFSNAQRNCLEHLEKQ